MRRMRTVRTLRTVLAGTVLLIGPAAASCTSTPSGTGGSTPAGITVTSTATAPAVTVTSGGSSKGAAPTGPALSAGVAIRRAIEKFNSTAGGSVQAQQELLARMVAPGQRAGQRACPGTGNTISFEPVYASLALAPTWKPQQGTMTGTVYALPALIRIHNGDRITGTDLTDLHLTVNSGQVQFPALCVS